MRSELLVRIIVSLAILVPQVICAQLSNSTRAYQERYAVNLQGDFTVLGNTNMHCVSACPGSAVTNNGYDMGFVDVDGVASTLNSSRSDLVLPVGAVVKYAALYWGGVNRSNYVSITNPPGSLNMDQVQVMAPGAGSYTTTNASVRNVENTVNPDWYTFLAFADITAMVQAAGSGQYYVADIALATGNDWTGPHGGWSMVVVYETSAIVTRRINIWDGFDFFGFGGSTSFTVLGLNTPVSGAFESKVAYYGMDGEASYTGDFVAVNGTSLGDGMNPTNNVLNGSFSYLGAPVTTRLPLYTYNWGMDLDVFDATGLVPNSASSAAVQLGSTNEGIWGGVFVISNEVAVPQISKTMSPATIELFETATVTINISNPAGGVLLSGVGLIDSLPSGMILADPLNFTSTCVGTGTSSSPGDDYFQFAGGAIPTGTNCTIQFDVTTTLAGSFTNIAPVREADFINDQSLSLLAPSQDELVVNCPTPVLSVTSATNCSIDDGQLHFSGFVPNSLWTMAYQLNAGPVVAANYSANNSGEIHLPNLANGNYTSIQASVANCSYSLPNTIIPYLACPDDDSDGYSNYVDLDDDNDGILDIDECNGTWILDGSHTVLNQTSSNLNTIASGVSYDISTINGVGLSTSLNPALSNFVAGAQSPFNGSQTHLYVQIETDQNAGSHGTLTILFPSTVVDPTIRFSDLSSSVTSPDWSLAFRLKSPGITMQLLQTDGEFVILGDTLRGTVQASTNASGLVKFQGATTELIFELLHYSPTAQDGPVRFAVNMGYSSCSDVDADGVDSSFDLDSDNDGIYDAVEAGHGAAMLNGRLTGAVDLFGIPVSVSAGGGAVNYSYADSDTNAILDSYELDADSDGCFDVLEAGYSDANKDGLLGTTPVLVDPLTGLVTSTGP